MTRTDGAQAPSLSPRMIAGVPLVRTAENSTCNASLALLIDESGSVENGNWRIQLRATADALTHPDVLDAIRKTGGIAVMTRAFDHRERNLTDWHVIRTPAEAQAYAERLRLIAETPAMGGATEIGRAVQNTFHYFASSPCGRRARMVVDVSSDAQSDLSTMRKAREIAHAAGITINGLAVPQEEIKDPDPMMEPIMQLNDIRQRLKDYLVTDDGFAMETNWENYHLAIRRKLIEEIASATPGR